MVNIENYTLLRLRVIARSKTQQCYSPNCKNPAIRSHIQQAEGPLRHIAIDGKVIQLQVTNRLNKLSYKFEKVGIKDRKGDVLNFFGFCPECDHKLFEPIETPHYDMYNYKNQLLHSYRGLLNEFYKKEYNLKHYELIFNCQDISEETKEQFRHKKIEQFIGSYYIKYFKELYEKDLANETNNFEFLILKLPRFKICTSAIFLTPIIVKNANQLIAAIEAGTKPKPPTSFSSISLIPTEDCTFCLLGQPNDLSLSHRLEFGKITKYTMDRKIKFVSDIIMKNIESWCVSIDLFEVWERQKRGKQILHEIQKYLPANMKSREIKFNLFKDLNM